MKTVSDFIHRLQFDELPAEVVEQAKICLLDLLGVAVAGHATRLSRILGDFVASQYPGDVPLLFSDKRASACGAALFGGMLIDSIDAHDGQVLTKGHVGVAILPGLLAAAEQRQLDGKELLTALVLGYEIATRAGIALHATAADYHTSGAWNSIGVAAVVARLHGLDAEQTWQALGSAEFYGPRSQMMRCIDHPTMVKDGSGWGALTGISAALLAEAGFTGAPAVTLSAPEVASIWADLGQRWYILEQYFKAYPVCRWAQPAVEAVRQLRAEHQFAPAEIEQIDIHSFHEATRLHVRQPDTTEQAQYSLPFSVACALLDDVVTAQAVAETDQGLFNPARRALSNRVVTHEVADYNALFPAERWAHARIRLKDGRELLSRPAIARGNPENPLSRDELIDKYQTLAGPALPSEVLAAIRDRSLALDSHSESALKEYLALLATPVA
ncbi:MmgE/PrpD family protein [Marinobacterium arenosum]|uniref:MmgE/PrpD family protein n=1 Tax=Marinobacterium arenosum TaxID=2862496 RepID=UPI001C97C540|nr:MmgE/PrpD family protein [Marinobacterium arenosum]MBY4677538.1 MmgE/PrpD family protein [Marinobacterium arenosum]